MLQSDEWGRYVNPDDVLVAEVSCVLRNLRNFRG